jgi:pyrophosphate--fructose-6-phosphate 1-phosphotransferase
VVFVSLCLQVILGEEVSTSKMTLFDVTKQICDAVQARAEKGTLILEESIYNTEVA